jgi:hypothetical protein
LWESGGEGIAGGKTPAEMLTAVATVDVEKYTAAKKRQAANHAARAEANRKLKSKRNSGKK